jgi:hypothetical protein
VPAQLVLVGPGLAPAAGTCAARPAGSTGARRTHIIAAPVLQRRRDLRHQQCICTSGAAGCWRCRSPIRLNSPAPAVAAKHTTALCQITHLELEGRFEQRPSSPLLPLRPVAAWRPALRVKGCCPKQIACPISMEILRAPAPPAHRERHSSCVHAGSAVAVAAQRSRHPAWNLSCQAIWAPIMSSDLPAAAAAATQPFARSVHARRGGVFQIIRAINARPCRSCGPCVRGVSPRHRVSPSVRQGILYAVSDRNLIANLRALDSTAIRVLASGSAGE